MNTVSIPYPYDRVSSVQDLLSQIRPIVSGGRRPVGTYLVTHPATKSTIVAATDVRTGESHRDWLFRTSADDVWGNYSEQWFETASGEFALNQAALQLYLVPGPNVRTEIFALHCEPNVIANSVTSRCKKGIHAHVTADKNVLSHAHIPFAYSQIDQILESATTFTEAVREALEIIEVEIIGRFV